MDLQLEHEFVTTNGVRLHVVNAGPPQGPLVILLHGFPEFWYGWHRQIAALAEAGFRVMVPDQRGYNLSDKPKGIAAYRLDILVQDVVGLIAHTGRSCAFIAGHDWGGVVAWWLALTQPALVEKLAILNAPHPRIMRQHLLKHKVQRRKSWYVFFYQLPWLPERWFSRQGWRIGRITLTKSSQKGTFSPVDIEYYLKAWAQPGAITAMLNWYRAAMWRPPRIPADIIIRVPTKILWGRRDYFLNQELATASAAVCNEVSLEFIDKATHWLQHEHPEYISEQLQKFFIVGENAILASDK